MYTHDPDPSKRIPKSLATTATLVGNYTLADAAVALIPAVVVVLCFQLVVPSDLAVWGYRVHDAALPLVGLGVLLGCAVVALTPTYTSSFDWLRTLAGFYRRPRTQTHTEAGMETRIERVHPEHDALERTDGTVIGLVRVDPPSMALATDAEWTQKAQAFRGFLDTVVEFPIQLYATTRPFPVDAYLAHYEDRLTDPDVRANPQLARLIEEYIAWYGAELDARQMTIRDHYVIVGVAPHDVRFEAGTGQGMLARLPVIGVFVDALLAPRVADERAACVELLDERLRRVEAGLRAIDGCHAERVTAVEAARVVAEYWHGEPVEYGDLDAVFRTRPLIDGGAA
ncbi:hypothetical protein [Halarchaeum sp. P4]|uniref:hypothetical protein n=1 Tax=Halarchaeum sp. P4 TaxID=3421639 RepID=UPI003EBEF4B9